ncbi:Anaphase-promoting complex subunit 1 [Myotisia sp. PD_48]|nr:Anaphase-promoting complex subunit 1 [Myotisia sp. PD_48]
MAAVSSLGLDKPSGLSYLVAESILPPNASEEDFTWRSYNTKSADGQTIEEELLYTDSCVVWSSGGVVKRSFRFDVEKEKIIGAVFTQFSNDKKRSKNGSSPISRHMRGFQITSVGIIDTKGKGRSDAKKRKRVVIQDQKDPYNISELPTGDNDLETQSKALVIALQSQIHIYFLPGDRHVAPLPFELDSIWPTPHGLLLQRKFALQREVSVPSAPPNSFISSQNMYSSLRHSASFNLSRGTGSRPSLTISPPEPPKWPLKPETDDFAPRLFSLLDPNSELGLVAVPPSSVDFDPMKVADALDPAEEVLYVSSSSEIPTENYSTKSTYPLILIVTLNSKTGAHNIWTARYKSNGSSAPSNRRRKSSNIHAKRRSSYFELPTGATTPVGAASFRESFGGPSQGRSVSQPFPHHGSTLDDGPKDTDDIASQLGQDFEEVGVSRASRRISSLLARSDLTASHDRTTFSDLATSQLKSSFHGGSRRGESFGGPGSRLSKSFRQRNSLPPANSSVYSNNGSFLDAPVDRLLESLNNGGDFEGFESMEIRETISGLQRQVSLHKIGGVSAGFSTTYGLSGPQIRQKFEVFVISSPYEAFSKENESTPLAVCMLNRNSKSLIVVSLSVQKSDLNSQMDKRSQDKKAKLDKDDQYYVCAINVHHGSNIIDCRKLVDKDVSRMLVLSTAADGRPELTLQAPWSILIKVELPPTMLLQEPYPTSVETSPPTRRELSQREVQSNTLILQGLANSTDGGRVDIIDNNSRRHRIQIQMQAQNFFVGKVLSLCRYALQSSEKSGDGIQTAWWQALKWLHSKKVEEDNLEWTALVVVLFSMAVCFIDDNQAKTGFIERSKRTSLRRTSAGNFVDLSEWSSMMSRELGASNTSASWMKTAAWGWISETDNTSSYDNQVGGATRDMRTGDVRNEYIVRCAGLAREFITSPDGAAAIAAIGNYFPTPATSDQETGTSSLRTIILALHLLREELKLSIIDVSSSERGLLLPVLAQLGGWLGWSSWSWKTEAYYGAEIMDLEKWRFEETQISRVDVPQEPFTPPSIFAFVESFFQRRQTRFLTILDLVSDSSRKPTSGKLWEQASRFTPRTMALTGFLYDLDDNQSSLERVILLTRWNITISMIDTLPDGISAMLHEAIVCCQSNPPLSWGPSLLELIDREDLYLSTFNIPFSLPGSRPQLLQSHDAIRDVRHIGNSAVDINSINSFEVSAEADRQAVTRLIFREDRRFYEAVKILNQTKPAVAECFPEPEWSEADLLDAQKDLVQLVTLRTLSIPPGRGMLAFNGRVPLLTEKLPIPSFSLQCVMKPSNVTISADRTAFVEEKACWAFFHNGVATGLAISKSAKGIDTSWILYNKPGELTNRHAGFLFALGLNGHLKSLAKWVAFKYLTPKHTMTSIGLLLGLSVSYLGTMDALITRLLSVHVTRMLPAGAAELNLSPLTQTAGVLGIGLLYINSQHRRMTEVVLSEIEHMDEQDPAASENYLRYEGYRLAAGFALGFINLGKGNDLKGLQDMRIVERLLALAVGTKEANLVHVFDRAAPGATIALALLFMKSNDASIARKIDIPDTEVQFDYVRPDLFLLRTLARHLIMWDSITPSFEWVQSSLPKFYRWKYRLPAIRKLCTDDMPYFNVIAGLCFAIGLRFAGSGSVEARDLLTAYLDQFIRICRLPAYNYDAKLTQNSVRNCQDIIALSAAAVMAGTGDIVVFRRFRLLHGRVDGDTNYGSHMAIHMAIGLLFLGGGTYTLGSSNLAVASLLCSLYPIFPTHVLDNNCHLQVFRHLWVLAAEPRCIIPRDLDTRRPITIPISLTLNTGEIKEIFAPCLLPNLEDISVVKIRNSSHWNMTLDFKRNESLRDKFRDGDQSVYLRRRSNYAADSSIFSSTLATLSDMQDVPASGANAGSLRPINNMALTNPKSPLYVHKTASAGTRIAPRHIWDWVFNLKALQSLDMFERSAVLPYGPFHQPLQLLAGKQPRNKFSLPAWLRPTMVDTRLMLDNTIRNLMAAAAGRGAGEDVVQDRLWQLRLLFAWQDNVDSLATTAQNSENDVPHTKSVWLRKDIIEDARWKIRGIQAGDMGITNEVTEERARYDRLNGLNDPSTAETARQQKQDGLLDMQRYHNICDNIALTTVPPLLRFYTELVHLYDATFKPGVWSKRFPGAKKNTGMENAEDDFHGIPISQYIGRWVFLNTTYWDFGDESGVPDDQAEHPESLFQILNQPGQQPYIPVSRSSYDHPLSMYPMVESYLLNYFIEAIGPNCSLSPGYNPYLALVIPISFGHLPLRNILLAISANQLRLLGDHRFEKEAYLYKQRALNGLQNEINERRASYGAVATVLMMCFHDISDGCSPSWITHLRGGLQLMNLLSSKITEDYMLKQFFIMYFVAHDIMGRAAVEDISEAESVDHTWSESDDLEVISKIRPISADESSHFNTCRAQIEASLQALRQTLPAYAANRQDLLRVAEAKRLAALLYLRERLGNPHTSPFTHPVDMHFHRLGMTPFHPYATATGSGGNWQSILTSANLSIPLVGTIKSSPISWEERLVAGILSLISTLPDSPTLLWPLFVVGNAEVDSEEQRRFVLERLNGIQRMRNLGSVRGARMAIENAYRARDLEHPRGKVWGRAGPGISLA